MDPNDVGPAEDDFSAHLAAYDEALAGGRPPAEAPAVPDAELLARLRRARDCLHRLEECWPRTVPDFLGHLFTHGMVFDAATRSVRFGRFEIRRRVGEDGTVFRAFDPERGREVTLRVLVPEEAAPPGQETGQVGPFRYLVSDQERGRREQPPAGKGKEAAPAED
jgi:hypothetical protein